MSCLQRAPANAPTFSHKQWFGQKNSSAQWPRNPTFSQRGGRLPAQKPRDYCVRYSGYFYHVIWPNIRPLAEEDFALKDEVGEAKYNVDLARALRLSKKNQGKLLQGHIFYVTPRVPIDTKLLKNVVNACGGQVRLFSDYFHLNRLTLGFR